MLTFLRLARILVRVSGVVLLLLGMALWAGAGPSVANAHIMTGTAFALLLAVTGGATFAVTRAAPAAVAVIAVAVIVVAFGMLHSRILAGPHHWLIRLAHVVIGVAALALANRAATQAIHWPARAAASPSRTEN